MAAGVLTSALAWLSRDDDFEAAREHRQSEQVEHGVQAPDIDPELAQMLGSLGYLE